MSDERQGMNIRDILFDLGKIVDGAVAGNLDMIKAYVAQLEAKCEAAGEQECAERLRQIGRRRIARKMSLSKLASGEERRLPVDGESRLPVADQERYQQGEVPLILAPSVKESVDQFLKAWRAVDRLLAHGLEPAASLLLFGPPGCGKTQLARFIASELELPLITARMDSLISSYLGSTGKNLRLLFDFAATQPCILFLDEFDALAKMRDDSRELGELKRVVISLLQNIDALGRDHLLIAATNHEHLLDPAVWRRFIWRIHIDFPDSLSRRALLSLFFRGFACDDTLDKLAAVTSEFTGAQLQDVAEGCVRDAVLEDTTEVYLRHAIDRMLRIASNGNGQTPSLGERIHTLYSRDKKTFTQAKLAGLFGISQPQVSRILKEFRGGDST